MIVPVVKLCSCASTGSPDACLCVLLLPFYTYCFNLTCTFSYLIMLDMLCLIYFCQYMYCKGLFLLHLFLG